MRQYNPLEDLEKDPSLKPYRLPPIKQPVNELNRMWFEGFWVGFLVGAALFLLFMIRNGY